MVETFYGHVQNHEILGPYFAQHIAADAWPAHLDRMCRFWSSTLLASGQYIGNPLQVHGALPDLQRAHFRVWLDLFAQVIAEVLPPETVPHVMAKAERMGQRLQTVAKA